MTDNLACYSGSGCPEQFPNGNDGQIIQVVGGTPTWVDSNTVGGLSVITPDTPAVGVFQHDDGTGTLSSIDTRGSSNPYNPAADAGTTLTATTMEAAVDELAQADRPFRIIGAAGADGLLAQPQSQNNVQVADNVQHTGRVLFGGAVGDAIISLNQGEFLGGVSLVGQASSSFRTMTMQRIDLATHRWDTSVRGVTNWNAVRHHTNIPVFIWSYGYDDNGNWTNDAGLMDSGVTLRNSAQHVMFLGDRNFPESVAVAPTAPASGDTIAMWAKRSPALAELFVMDGAGNVTQLSSHSEAIDELLGMSGLGHSLNSYNVYNGKGEGVDPKTGKSIEYDIDTGDYSILLSDGTVESTGSDDRLAYGKNSHAPLSDMGYEGGRGESFWDFAEEKRSSANEKSIIDWDAYAELHGKKKAKEDLGPKPKRYKKQKMPNRLKRGRTNG